jgi:voltage-gated potassium channel Kch
VVAAGEVQPVLADDLISRIVVHSSRQTGLSGVYSELLDFEGSEIYALPKPALIGKTYGEALAMFETGALVGLCDADGAVRINPEMGAVIGEGALAVLIAEDADSVSFAQPHTVVIDETAIRPPAGKAKTRERTLILGWNRRGAGIARELTYYMAPGSELTIAADAPGFERDMAALEIDRAAITLNHHVVDTRERAALESLDVLSYDHVIVLAYSDQLAAHPADTRTLVTLLHVRHIAEREGRRVTIVSEMADIRNRELAQVTHADDFVVSNKLVSLMLAQASENQYISAIFADLLDEEGSEIYMRPVESLVAIDRPVNFYTVIESARRRGETAFGYCRRREDQQDARNLGGVVLDPNKSEAVAYAPGDFIVTLARD